MKNSLPIRETQIPAPKIRIKIMRLLCLLRIEDHLHAGKMHRVVPGPHGYGNEMTH
jgi:hypothetical protein